MRPNSRLETTLTAIIGTGLIAGIVVWAVKSLLRALTAQHHAATTTIATQTNNAVAQTIDQLAATITEAVTTATSATAETVASALTYPQPPTAPELIQPDDTDQATIGIPDHLLRARDPSREPFDPTELFEPDPDVGGPGDRTAFYDPTKGDLIEQIKAQPATGGILPPNLSAEAFDWPAESDGF